MGFNDDQMEIHVDSSGLMMIHGDSWGFNDDSFHGDSWWESPLSIYAVNQQNWMINAQKWGWTTILWE
jgi:hypothetical protein